MRSAIRTLVAASTTDVFVLAVCRNGGGCCLEKPHAGALVPPLELMFLKHSLPHGSEYPRHGPSASQDSFEPVTNLETLPRVWEVRDLKDGRVARVGKGGLCRSTISRVSVVTVEETDGAPSKLAEAERFRSGDVSVLPLAGLCSPPWESWRCEWLRECS